MAEEKTNLTIKRKMGIGMLVIGIVASAIGLWMDVSMYQFLLLYTGILIALIGVLMAAKWKDTNNNNNSSSSFFTPHKNPRWLRRKIRHRYGC